MYSWFTCFELLYCSAQFKGVNWYIVILALVFFWWFLSAANKCCCCCCCFASFLCWYKVFASFWWAKWRLCYTVPELYDSKGGKWTRKMSCNPKYLWWPHNDPVMTSADPIKRPFFGIELTQNKTYDKKYRFLLHSSLSRQQSESLSLERSQLRGHLSTYNLF